MVWLLKGHTKNKIYHTFLYKIIIIFKLLKKEYHLNLLVKTIKKECLRSNIEFITHMISNINDLASQKNDWKLNSY